MTSMVWIPVKYYSLICWFYRKGSVYSGWIKGQITQKCSAFILIGRGWVCNTQYFTIEWSSINSGLLWGNWFIEWMYSDKWSCISAWNCSSISCLYGFYFADCADLALTASPRSWWASLPGNHRDVCDEGVRNCAHEWYRSRSQRAGARRHPVRLQYRKVVLSQHQ